ncbi:MAG: tetratricopeptide repeat protein [Bacteroidetes bacterium]|nr:MAG: tetratricopeptide repeat protein [Bacteroidota bacterium]
MSKRLQLLEQILRDSPNDSFALFAIAKEYEGMGEWDKALDFYLQLRRNDPDYIGLYYHLGKLYEHTNKPDHALEAYRTGIEVARKAGDMHALSELNTARLELDDSDDDDDY